MKNPHRLILLAAWTLLGCALLPARAADPVPVPSAKELAGRLSTLQQDGSSYIRIRMEVKQAPGSTNAALQIQIMQRRTKTSTDVIYQVLWP